MEATATSSPSSFKLALVSCLIFLGLLACCSGQMKNKEFKVSCQSSYVKDTLGAITCEVNWDKLKYQCQHTTQRLLQAKVTNDFISKCYKASLGDVGECKGKEPAHAVFNCEEEGNIVKYHCHFTPTERDEGRNASCVLECLNSSTGIFYKTLVTENCLLNFGTPPKQEPQPTLGPPVPPSQPTEAPPGPPSQPTEAPPGPPSQPTKAPPGPSTRRPPKKRPSPQKRKKFPVMSFIIACAIAGVIVFVVCLSCTSLHEDECDSEGRERTELQTDASRWTEPTTATTGF